MAEQQHHHHHGGGWTVLKAFALGGAVGTAVGYVVGLLTAPRPGTETREQWKEQFGQASEKVADIVEQSKDSLQHSRERAQVVAQAGKSRTQEIMDTVMQKMHHKPEQEEAAGME